LPCVGEVKWLIVPELWGRFSAPRANRANPPNFHLGPVGGCGGAGCSSSHGRDEAANNGQPEAIEDQLLGIGWKWGAFFFRLRGRIEHGSG